MHQRILVAVDLSDASGNALRDARALADAAGGELAMVHVLPDFADFKSLFPQSSPTGLPATDEFAAKARDQIGRWAAEAAQDPNLELFLDKGDPAATIVRRAESWGADLIVVGSQGRSTLERMFLGSVANKVVRTAHCPVLVSRPRRAGGNVIAATDLSDPSLPAIVQGAAEARRRGSHLVVVHVVDSSVGTFAASAGGLFGVTVALPPPELQTEVREALVVSLSEAMERLGAPGDAVVLYGSPVAAIVEGANEREADLIVVGTHGRTGLSRAAVGSVAEGVVKQARCSVLVVRHSAQPTVPAAG
jgi:nucleotide-binding universal stress UspA family protein